MERKLRFDYALKKIYVDKYATKENYWESQDFFFTKKVITSFYKFLKSEHPDFVNVKKTPNEWFKSMEDESYCLEFIFMVVDAFRNNPEQKTGNPKKNHGYVLFVIDTINKIFGYDYDSRDTELDWPLTVICDKCNVEAEFVDTRKIYCKYQYGMKYICPVCGASVGVHNGTSVPLGDLADDELKKYRKYVHYYFDKMWQEKGWDRNKAYSWLSEELGIPKEKTHIAMFDLQICKRALAIVGENR